MLVVFLDYTYLHFSRVFTCWLHILVAVRHQLDFGTNYRPQTNAIRRQMLRPKSPVKNVENNVLFAPKKYTTYFFSLCSNLIYKWQVSMLYLKGLNLFGSM